MFIDYFKLLDAVGIELVRKVLKIIAKDGLQGEHHLYISFKTNFEGNVLDNTFIEEYKDEMTIVLQHQFRELIIEENYFSIVLTFSGIPYKLKIMFNSITLISDPYAQFTLKFNTHNRDNEKNYNKNSNIDDKKDTQNTGISKDKIINLDDFR